MILMFKARAKTAGIAGYCEDFGEANWASKIILHGSASQQKTFIMRLAISVGDPAGIGPEIIRMAVPQFCWPFRGGRNYF